MKKFKICMLGAFAVGKTSLVQRYVSSIFSEKYQTTLGVKIDKKSLDCGGQKLELMLWDLAGEDEFIKVRDAYLRGSSGAILVADGSRAETLDVAIGLKKKLYQEVGQVPIIMVVNKSDLKDSWKIDRSKMELLLESGWQIVEASAKNNENVDHAFQILAQQLLDEIDK